MKRFVMIASATVLLAITAIVYGSFSAPLEAANFGVAIDDFVVNDDESGGCSQNDPMVAMNSSGDAVVVWRDSRYALGLIYAMRYDSDLNPEGPSFRVSNNINSVTYWPSVDMNSLGSFVVVWMSGSSPDFRKICAQLYDSDGRSIGENFEVSDPLYTSDRRYPSVAMNEDGSFVVCWSEEIKGQSTELVARLMDATGNPLGPVFQISDPSENDVSGYPRVASDGYGSYMTTWTESSGGEVLVCSFDSSATIISGPTVVNRVNPDVAARSSCIAIAPSGRYVVTWLTSDGSKVEYHAYMKLLDETGSPLTDDVDVCSTPLPNYNYPVEIAMEASGDFTLTWIEPRNGDNDMYMREYDADGNPLGSDRTVSGADGPDNQRDGAIATDGNGRRLIVWEDSRNGHGDIYGQRYSGNVAELGNGMRINDDVATANQTQPTIACNESGQFSIVWMDRRSSDDACFMQVFDAAGNPVSNNVEVTTDIHGSQLPVASMDATGRTTIVWHDNGDIRAQYFDETGSAVGADFSINDTTYAGLTFAAAMNDSGKSVVAWWIGSYPHGPDDGVFVRRIDEEGNPIGPSLMVNDYLYGNEFHPCAAINSDGAFVVAWYCGRGVDSTGLYAQLFDSAGVPVGSNILIGTTPDVRVCDGSAICMDSSGAFVAAWRASESSFYTLRAQRYDPSGTPVGPEIVVNDNPHSDGYRIPDIACDDDGNFVIVWHERPGDDRHVYAQIFDSDGNPQGGNFLIPDPPGLPFRQEDPSVAVNGASIFFAWEDTRAAKGYDIYAKATDWSAGLAVCGDLDDNGSIDIDDVICLIDHIFNDFQRPGIRRSGDANSSGYVDIDDVVYMVNYIFMSGNAPCDYDND